MYESPSQQNLKEIIITEECIISGSNPIRVFHTQKKTKSNKENSTVKSKKLVLGNYIIFPPYSSPTQHFYVL